MKRPVPITFLTIVIGLSIVSIIREVENKNEIFFAVSPQSLSQVAAVSDFNSSLVAHYTFNNTANDAVGSNPGILQGGPIYLEGKFDKAIQFDGVDDYINAGTGANLTGAMTISVWVNSRASTANDFIAGRGSGAGSASDAKQFLLYYYDTGRVGFQVSNGVTSLTTRSSVGSVADGSWTHVVGVYDGSGEVRVYVNGVQSGTNTLSGFGALNAASIGLGVGARQTGSTVSLFDGSMDDLRIYNRALSSSEIQELYGNVQPQPSAPPVQQTPQQPVPNNPPSQNPPPTSLSIDLVQLQGGSFRMGDILGDFGSSHLPVRQVTLNKFSIFKYETSNNQAVAALQYAYNNGRIVINPTHVALVGKTEPLFGMNNWNNEIVFSNGVFSVRSGRGLYPAARISWYGAVALANWFSEMQGLDPVYNLETWTWDRSKGGYRLPTEAEWEYAARGGYDGLRFPWGNTISQSQANYLATVNTYAFDMSTVSGHHPGTVADSIKSLPVDSFSPNNYGLYNMAGNAWEWVWDWSGRYNANDTNNPIGPATGIAKIFRGGAWMPTAERASVAFRYQGSNMANTIFDVGVRFACTSCTGGSIFVPPPNSTPILPAPPVNNPPPQQQNPPPVQPPNPTPNPIPPISTPTSSQPPSSPIIQTQPSVAQQNSQPSSSSVTPSPITPYVSNSSYGATQQYQSAQSPQTPTRTSSASPPTSAPRSSDDPFVPVPEGERDHSTTTSSSSFITQVRDVVQHIISRIWNGIRKVMGR